MKQDTQSDMKLVSCKCRLDAIKTCVLIICKDGMKINAGVNARNWLTEECMIKELFGILVIVNVSVINDMMLDNI